MKKRSVTVKELDHAEFGRYGAFANLINPDAPHLGEEPIEFYRDMALLDLGGKPAALSTCRVCRRPLVVDVSEYHNGCGEALVPLDGDVLIHVAPASGGDAVPTDEMEVYRVPKGTAVVLRPGVWHHAPFALEQECVNVLIILPERTYAVDCHVERLSKKERVRIAGA
ncbi:ureidoglycolate lyase [bacterium]|nr:ureidoglycolate lyase [bacterium]